MIRIGEASIEVSRRNIITMDVDAIVCPTNNHLWMGSGTAGKLKKAGDYKIETEAVSQGPLDVGEAGVTRGGDLTARWIIHAVVTYQSLKTDEPTMRRAMRSRAPSAVWGDSLRAQGRW